MTLQSRNFERKMNDITDTCILQKSPPQNTLKLPINFECDSLKQKFHNGTTNKQQNKTNKEARDYPPFPNW